jgi:hypothetical protein
MKLRLIASAIVATIAFEPVQANASTDIPQPKRFTLDMPEEFPTFKELDEIFGNYQTEPKMTLNLTENITVGRIKIEPFEKFATSATKYRQLVGVSVRFKF